MRKYTKLLYIALAFALLFSLLPVSALAVGRVDMDRDCTLTLEFLDNGVPVRSAVLQLYLIENMSEIARLSPASPFDTYTELDWDCGVEGWPDLASTLETIIRGDSLPADFSGVTDSTGHAAFTGLRPGVYLVLGQRSTQGDYVYTASPFFVTVPGADEEDEEWHYDVTAQVKFSKSYEPVGDDTIRRSVLKIWKDNGHEAQRPVSVTVQLLCDGTVYDTVRLSAENNWRYSWDDLERSHSWLIREVSVNGYTTTVTSAGITFTVTNTYDEDSPPITPPPPPPPSGDYPTGEIEVTKRITGDQPGYAAPFTFVLFPKSDACPMPHGSVDRVKEITVNGAGRASFGYMEFTAPGSYSYAVSEKYGGVTGYTYDTAVYTVTFEVTGSDGNLSVVSVITDSSGAKVNDVVFTNQYTTPPPTLPQTGMLWWPVPVLMCAGMLCLLIGIARRRRNG